MPDAPSVEEALEPPADDEEYTVLELFGMKLTVRNPRLAEVLTTELGAAAGHEPLVLDRPTQVALQRTEIAEALPDVVLRPTLQRDEDRDRARADLRTRVGSCARALGFEVEPNGVWTSPTGLNLCTRTVDRPMTLAAASDLVEKLSTLATEIQGEECLSLFIVDDQETADVFRVAIRQRRAYDRMRTITLDNFQFIRSLLAARVIDHSGALVLLAPVAEIDVGEILSIVRTAASEDVD